MRELVEIPQVVMIKMGTRDMARWRYDYEQLKQAVGHVSIVTCHDEFLLPTRIRNRLQTIRQPFVRGQNSQLLLPDKQEINLVDRPIVSLIKLDG